MDCRVIQMEQDPRKAHFEYFHAMANPYVGLTVNVDATTFLELVKETHSNQPFGRNASAQIGMKECRQATAFLVKLY